MDKLIFRRQFLFSSKPTDKLKDWQFLAVGERYLYVHPDCELNYQDAGGNLCVLIGHFLNPHQKDMNNIQILRSFVTCESSEQISERLFPLVGRFVLFVQTKNDFFIFNDACGLKTVYYTFLNQGFYAASQPFLLKLVLPIQEEPFYEDYFNSDYVKQNREHWLPCGLTLFKNVNQLVPNHFINVIQYKQIRYWPKRKVRSLTTKEGVRLLSSLLQNTMAAAAKRFDLAMAMTAGMDSRLVLAASKDIAPDLFFYTLKYRDLTDQAADIKISKTLLDNLGYKHHVLDCTGKAEETFLKIYSANTPMAHVNDWRSIAYGIYRNYPQEKMAIRGNCVEVGRNYSPLYKIIKQAPSVDKMLQLQSGWKEFPWVKVFLEKWHNEVQDVKALDYDIMDLFYWEHRLGSWQAQSQLEWDMVQEMFTPFNNREIMEIMLGVDEKHRNNPKHFSFFVDLINSLWAELMKMPINPKSSKQKLKGRLKAVLTKLGVFQLARRLS